MARPVQLVRHSHTRLMWRSCSYFPTLDVPDQALLHGDQHALSHRLSGDMFFYLRHLGTSIFFGFFGHRPFILYVDTCCVWGGFGRFQTYLGATTRCLLFAGTGGVFTQRANSPPVFALFCFLILFFHTITNVRPRPPKPYIIVSRDRLSTGGTFFVVNVRFFIDS